MYPALAKMALTVAAKGVSHFKYIDIAVNLTDDMYKGVYHGTARHKDDLQCVLNRAWDSGLAKMFITGGNLEDCQAALELSKTHKQLYCTVGCHPTNCSKFDESGSAQQYLADLLRLASDNRDKVVAIGECGLDYDRLHFCPKDTQLKYFEQQFALAEETKLPMFLHNRNSIKDFIEIVQRNRSRFSTGVVHSFDGTKDDAEAITDLGLYIGINGCSLKTQDNIDAMCSIPTEKLMIETDAPWCEIRPTHAGQKYVKTKFPCRKKEKYEDGVPVKGRNEPAFIIQVLEVMAAARDEDMQQMADTIYENTLRVFCTPL